MAETGNARRPRLVSCLVGLLTLLIGASVAPPVAAADPAQTATITGAVFGAPGFAGASSAPVAGAVVTASTTSGTVAATTTGADGSFEIDNLPAPATYTLTVTPHGGYQPQTIPGVTLSPGESAFEQIYLQPLPPTVSGVVTDPTGRPVYGAQIIAVPQGVPCPAGVICGPEAAAGPAGSYSLALPYPGDYTLEAMDSGTTTVLAQRQFGPGQVTRLDVRLPPPSIPAHTTVHGAARALRLLNRERAANGLPAGIVLNQRWSEDCAAHTTYERDNRVLSHPENPKLRGASVGGNWAGTSSVLAEGLDWTSPESPWWDAPIHLIQLLSPSLSVVGIDDTRGWDCATTWPGMLRTPVAHDTIFTYPGNGTRGVPPAENAAESPFVPGQFVGIPEGRVAGRELFVYLNQAGRVGQAQVAILSAHLAAGRRIVRIRWVDNTTRTLGPYLSGGIILPLKPLRPDTRYTASVTVRDGSAALNHTWSFTTAGRRGR